MRIRILQLVAGAKEARGVTVVIDVFRAMSLEAYLLAAGAERVIPVGEEAAARELKAAHPDWILAGERHGRILPGFDLGNSPSAAAKLDVAGKTVIHTTSAGTQGIANAIHAERLLGGSFVNARATADYIRSLGAEEVSLVCMGLEAKEPTDEDTLCAEYLRSLLEGRPMELTDRLAALAGTSGAKFFDPAQQDAFPEPDFRLCVRPDIFPFAMELERTEGELPCMRRANA